jgi:hypothetical protein
MNIKLLVVGLVVIGAIIFAVIFANQFAINQDKLANTPMDVITVPGSNDETTEEALISESTEGLPTSTEAPDIEADLSDIDLSGLDDGLDDLNLEAEGL